MTDQRQKRADDDVRTEAHGKTSAVSYGLSLQIASGANAGRSARIGPGGLVVGSQADACGLVVEDKRVSRRHLEIKPHPAGALVRDLGSTNGTFLAGARITEAVVSPGALITVGDTDLSVQPENAPRELPVSTREKLAGLIGKSLPMRRLYTIIERAAPTDYTILIEGETGTGKEVVARAIHELSPRKDQPFVVFDCAATAESVLESELFGHVRGAFTGAIEPREGAFRAADGGTLFIDELNSLPIGLQAKLLRALESRRVRPVGADREVPVDIRVVAATNRPLRDEVDAGRFREDLFYRLCVVRAPLPPLRERVEDIPSLVAHFLRSAGNRSPVEGPDLARLMGHNWPGNVRELRNTIERALALAGGPDVPFSQLPIALGDASPLFAWPVACEVPFKEAKDALVSAFERRYATELLASVNGNIAQAARKAGLSRRYLFELLKKHGLLPSDAPEESGED